MFEAKCNLYLYVRLSKSVQPGRLQWAAILQEQTKHGCVLISVIGATQGYHRIDSKGYMFGETGQQ